MGKKITLSFGGGMEILFNNTKEREVELPDNVVNIKDLIAYMKDELLQERPELFVLNDTVRPGIIVLINNADWEIEGGLEYEIEKGDEITFISTLHGG
ncbi:ubiquitin related modifier 1 [Neocallimastix californiae]|uniref:Ubiquitin-related modifier 1 n=1 Tax=Neocallimastix californiae TaxID=1754190 RepID=A0A1Y2CQK2_9FUNG|nr:ubiquitin related modifier 1 [Neocallimastix californiae]|eukprot:ORY49226.1 ubiquitin related modifier 1 [Neocallimastix californiae]